VYSKLRFVDNLVWDWHGIGRYGRGGTGLKLAASQNESPIAAFFTRIYSSEFLSNPGGETHWLTREQFRKVSFVGFC